MPKLNMHETYLGKRIIRTVSRMKNESAFEKQIQHSSFRQNILKYFL